MSTAAPQRRFQLALRLGGDSIEDILRAIGQLRFDIEDAPDGMKCPREISSGAPNVGYRLVIIENPDQTHEKYFAEIDQWLAENRQ